MDGNSISQSLREKSQASSIPFFHIRINDMFDTSTYEDMLRYLPPLEACHELKHRDAMVDGHSTRLQFGFTQAELARLDDAPLAFWTRFVVGLTSYEVTETVRDVLREGLRTRFGSAWNTVKLKPKPWIIHDEPGYAILPHPDIQAKAITLQIYLPADDSQKSLGTSLYRKNGETFEEVSRVPFVPNSGYAFAVADNSWHGCEKVPRDAGCRNSLMVIYYVG